MSFEARSWQPLLYQCPLFQISIVMNKTILGNQAYGFVCSARAQEIFVGPWLLTACSSSSQRTD